MGAPSPAGLRLRLLTRADVPFVTALAQDPRVVRWVRDGRPWSAELVADRTGRALADGPADRPGAARWFVAELPGPAAGADGADGPAVAGAAVAVALVVATRGEGSAEVGYWVAPGHWGRGIATAALGLALELLPAQLGTDVLTARVHPDNAASAAVLRHHGFRADGAEDGLDRFLRRP